MHETYFLIEFYTSKPIIDLGVSMKKVRVGVIVLFTLMMLGTLAMSAMAQPPTLIIVKPGEGTTIYDYISDGTEPPPHLMIYDIDGNLRLYDPNR